ncbi:translation initiation factor IF3-1, mitochondrial isoform X1 [Spinacia oleracea]|uniref:Translation initiation factor IF3-1, mitochondrial isoform X1 n=2 Tax=Spinacia oleracea TaxID=3562 RepID=A0A9R0HVA4_SPIOL|nr:translation initiation factor IF3-1, mitochondrial isoform X1 [Spinacia oleracea]
MTAIFCRIKEVKPNNFIHHFKRYYFQIPAPRLANQTAASQRVSDYFFLTNSSRIRSVSQRRDELFNSRVRFFAAPVQIKKKEEIVNPSRPRINEEIKTDILRVVTDEGHTIMSRHDALTRAKNLDLDLVEVDRLAKPPVCKIVDYQRERYKKQVREKERAKIKSAGSLKRGGCKEIRVSAKSESKDVKIKADTIKRLMERGYRVKCMVTGTEDQDLTGTLSQISALIEDEAFVEEERPTFLIVRHVKFGMSKKGGKTSKDKTAASPKIHNTATAADLGKEAYSEEFDMDNDEEVEASLQCEEESAWSDTSVSSAVDQNFAEVFDLSHDVKGSASSQEKQMPFDSKGTSSTFANSASRSTPPVVPSFGGPNVAQETGNRYAKSAANNASAVKIPMRFPNSETQPQSHLHPKVHPPTNFRGPPDEIPPRKGEIGSGQPNSNSLSSTVHHQPPSNIGSPGSQATGFGTFSSTTVDLPKAPRLGGLEGSPPMNSRLPPRQSQIQNQSSHPNSNLSGSIRHQQAPSNTGFGTFSSATVDLPKPSRIGGLEGSPPIKSRLPPNEIPQPRDEIQNRPSHPNSNLSGSIGHRQPPSNTGSPRSQATGFGTFSSTKVDADIPNSVSPSDVTRNSGPGKAPGTLNPPISRPDGPQKSVSPDKKWGIFSK